VTLRLHAINFAMLRPGLLDALGGAVCLLHHGGSGKQGKRQVHRGSFCLFCFCASISAAFNSRCSCSVWYALDPCTRTSH
jgi:hypothetical protein